MLIEIALFGMLVGAILALLFRVLALVPVMAFLWLGLVAAGLTGDDTPAEIAAAMVVLMVAMEAGYLGVLFHSWADETDAPNYHRLRPRRGHRV
jgi:hypothetical protein